MFCICRECCHVSKIPLGLAICGQPFRNCHHFHYQTATGGRFRGDPICRGDHVRERGMALTGQPWKLVPVIGRLHGRVARGNDRLLQLENRVGCRHTSFSCGTTLFAQPFGMQQKLHNVNQHLHSQGKISRLIGCTRRLHHVLFALFASSRVPSHTTASG